MRAASERVPQPQQCDRNECTDRDGQGDQCGCWPAVGAPRRSGSWIGRRGRCLRGVGCRRRRRCGRRRDRRGGRTDRPSQSRHDRQGSRSGRRRTRMRPSDVRSRDRDESGQQDQQRGRDSSHVEPPSSPPAGTAVPLMHPRADRGRRNVGEQIFARILGTRQESRARRVAPGRRDGWVQVPRMVVRYGPTVVASCARRPGCVVKVAT